MQKFTSRNDAIQTLIVDPIEASGEIENARAAYDIDAIADAMLDAEPDGYIENEDADFWAVVEANER